MRKRREREREREKGKEKEKEKEKEEKEKEKEKERWEGTLRAAQGRRTLPTWGLSTHSTSSLELALWRCHTAFKWPDWLDERERVWRERERRRERERYGDNMEIILHATMAILALFKT